VFAEAIERARTFLWSRRGAYRAVFDLSNARSADVLRDLAKFCRAHASTAHVDPYMAARLDGRREVFLRIQTHLQLTDEQLWQLYQ
jgi:hypothetical protein